MKTRTVYKVVKSLSPSRFHSCVLNIDSKHYTAYVIGETTTNERMPLFALKTLNDAKDCEWSNCFILECQAVISPKQPNRRANICFSNERFELFWKQVWNKKRVTVPVESLPPGTVFCSSITPIKVIRSPLY